MRCPVIARRRWPPAATTSTPSRSTCPGCSRRSRRCSAAPPAREPGGERVSIDPAAQLRHELRTPLNHIIGYAEMLLEDLPAGAKPELAAGLSALRGDARQLLALLNEVLARGR